MILYLYIRIIIKSKNLNWEENRCNPLLIPFAKFIRNGDENFNNENFKYCLDKLTSTISDRATAPIHNSMSYLESVYNSVGRMLEEIIVAMIELYKFIIKLFDTIIGKITAILFENNILFIKINNFINTILGFITIILRKFQTIVFLLKYVFYIFALSFLVTVVMPAITLLTVSLIAFIVFYIVSLVPLFGSWAVPVAGMWFAVTVITTILVVFLLLIYKVFQESAIDILEKTQIQE